MNVKQMNVVEFHELQEAVANELCKLPLGEMPRITRQEIDNYFVRLAENYGASNGVYLSFYPEPGQWDKKDEKLIKATAAKLLGSTAPILLHYSW